MKKLDKTNLIRLIALIVLLAVSTAAAVFFIPFVKSLLTEEGRQLLQNQIHSLGALGWVAFLLLQILQVIVAVIPGEPVEIVAGIFFGTFGGTGLCLLGMLIGSVAVFYLVRAVGKPLVFAFVSEEKFEKLKLLQDENKLETLIFILFLVPGTPKDALTYFVPLTKIAPLKFFILTTIARIPSVLSSTIVGQNLGNGNWLFAAGIFLLTAVVGLLGIFLNDKIQKAYQNRRKRL